MECSKCRVSKLSEEFPAAISAQCEHPPTVCLRCVESSLRFSVPPHWIATCLECGVRIMESEQRALKEDVAQFRCVAFKELAVRAEQLRVESRDQSKISGKITVALMDGDKFELQVTRATTIQDFRMQVCQKTGVKPHNQLLKHNGRTIEDRGSTSVWQDYGIPFGSVVHLVIVMYQVRGGTAVTGGSLEFKLSWTPTVLEGQLTNGRQPKIAQLLGVCTLLDGRGREVAIVHFLNTQYGTSVIHHGHSSFSRPSQSLSVHIPELPPHVTYLVFTLCSRHGMSMIRNPRVSLSDSYGTTLATYAPKVHQNSVRDGLLGAAYVLCCAMRGTSNDWVVVQCGARCSGYVHAQNKQTDRKRYKPIANAIESLLQGPLRRS